MARWTPAGGDRSYNQSQRVFATEPPFAISFLFLQSVSELHHVSQTRNEAVVTVQLFPSDMFEC